MCARSLSMALALEKITPKTHDWSYPNMGGVQVITQQPCESYIHTYIESATSSQCVHSPKSRLYYTAKNHTACEMDSQLDPFVLQILFHLSQLYVTPIFSCKQTLHNFLNKCGQKTHPKGHGVYTHTHLYFLVPVGEFAVSSV